MPKGPRGEKRPRDVVGAAVKVARILSHQIEEDIDPKKAAAAELASRGGKARKEALTPERRKEIARRAAMTRYGRRVETNRPEPTQTVMTDKEKLDLTARLAAYEMLLAELLIVVYAQKGYGGNRLLNFRKQMEKQFSDVIQNDEDHPVEIDPRRKALYDHMICMIDKAVNLLVEQKVARGRSEPSR